MQSRKILTISLILVMGITPILPNLSATKINSSNIATFETPKAYIIEGVPYVSQKYHVHCAYAGPTMIFNYFGANTTLEEVIFCSGMGYSICYLNKSYQRLPIEGWILSQMPKDYSFLASLYGLSSVYWEANQSVMTNDECWQQYFNRVKQNISLNIPVMTSVDGNSLPSKRNLFNFPEKIWNLFSANGHAAIIVGYNNTNGTVCFNDPISGYYGNPQYGNYCWMNLTDFRNAVEKTKGPKYSIDLFINVSDPLSKAEILEKAYTRNIERLKGNYSAYDAKSITKYLAESDGYCLGINASKKLKENFEKGLNHQIKTTRTYKNQGKLGIKYRLIQFICSYFPSILELTTYNCEVLQDNIFDTIALEKRYVSSFLTNISGIYGGYGIEANLFKEEAENWTKLAGCYSEFKEKGIFTSLPRAICLMKQMGKTMDNIITIQQKIIDGPSNG